MVSHDKLIFEMEILLKAMPEPSPAKTKITIEKNSANAALMASGWLASPGEPIAILLIGIFVEFVLALLLLLSLELESFIASFFASLSLFVYVLAILAYISRV